MEQETKEAIIYHAIVVLSAAVFLSIWSYNLFHDLKRAIFSGLILIAALAIMYFAFFFIGTRWITYLKKSIMDDTYPLMKIFFIYIVNGIAILYSYYHNDPELSIWAVRLYIVGFLCFLYDIFSYYRFNISISTLFRINERITKLGIKYHILGFCTVAVILAFIMIIYMDIMLFLKSIGLIIKALGPLL